MPTVGTISINVRAGTAQLNKDLDGVKQKFTELGSHSVSGVQATSAALRTLEGGITNNLRAAERFAANVLGLGPILQKAFPVFGAIAFAGIISELIGKVGNLYDSFKKLQQAPQRIAEGFVALNQPLGITNAELAVSNDKLANEIAKLQGKPENGLKLALDEAVAASLKLSESLRTNFTDLQKLLQDENIGSLKGFFTNRASTDDIKKAFIGEDGYGGYKAQIEKTAADYDERLASVKPGKNAKKEADAIQAQKDAAIQKILGDALHYVNTELARRTALEDVRNADTDQKRLAGLDLTGQGSTHHLADFAAPSPPEQGAGISELQGTQTRLRETIANYALSRANTTLEGTKDNLDKSKADPAKPYDDAIAELQAKLEAVKASASAIGLDVVGEALAKAFGDATEKVSALNSRLKETHQTLTLAQVADITGLEDSIALTEASSKLQTEQTAKLKADADELNRALAEVAQHHQESLDKLNAEVQAARALAAAEAIGLDAARKAQENVKLAGIADPEERALIQAKDEAEYQASINKTVAQLDRETTATNTLAEAYTRGVQARRDAELDNIRNSGQSPDVIAAQLALKQSQFRIEDIQSGSARSGGSIQDGYKQFFQEMVDNAQSAAQQTKEVLGNAFNSLNDQLAKLVTGQKVSWSSFFRSLSEQLAKMSFTNIEVGIAKKLGSLGGGENSGQSPTGIVGRTLGVLFGNHGAKVDGSSQAKALWVRLTASAGTGASGAAGAAGSALSGLGLDLPGVSSGPADGTKQHPFYVNVLSGGSGSSSSSSFGGLGGLFGGGSSGGSGLEDVTSSISYGGAMAEGGDVDPGKLYWTGENGPELFRAPSAGSIIPNHKLGGGDVHYHVDARGSTDPVMTASKVRQAIAIAHNSAISKSIKSMREQQSRTPQR